MAAGYVVAIYQLTVSVDEGTWKGASDSKLGKICEVAEDTLNVLTTLVQEQVRKKAGVDVEVVVNGAGAPR